MKRYTLTFWLFLTIFAFSVCSVQAENDAASTSNKSASTDKIRIVNIVLHPAPAPTPALKYQLLPPLLDRRPGNAVVSYLKYPHENERLMSDRDFWDSLSKLEEMPLPELMKELENNHKINCYNLLTDDNSWQFKMIQELERGARCESCDWQLPIHDHDFYSIILPELQAFRQISHLFAVRARVQIANGQYDQAVRTLQTEYAMGRHAAQGPCFVQCMIGQIFIAVTSRQVETFIQQPDAPNLYWALSFLPQPILDCRQAYETELAAFDLSFKELRDLGKKDYTAKQWQDLLERTIAKLGRIQIYDAPRRINRSQILMWVIENYTKAKNFLVDEGMPPAEVEAMPVAKVILLYSTRAYAIVRDESFKYAMLPYPVAVEKMQCGGWSIKTGEWVERQGRDALAGIISFTDISFSPIIYAKITEARAQRTIAALRVLEALRIYAAAHDGLLPEKLDNVKEVPIPLDPLRGKPFVYTRKDMTHAVLELHDPITSSSLRYQIEMKSKGTKQ